MSDDKFEDDRRQKRRENQIYGILFFKVVPIVAIIIGIIFLSIGIQNRNSSNGLDADVDFILTDQACPVVASTWIKEHQMTGDKGRKTGCNDIWVYTFTANHLKDEHSFYSERDDYTFETYDHTIRRDCDDCNRCDKKPPLFTVGEESRCWRPASPNGELNEWYRCGNKDCIKIISPQNDEERARQISGQRLIAGVICLSVGFPLVLIGHFAYKACMKEKPVDGEQNLPDSPSPMPATITTIDSKPPPLKGTTLNTANYETKANENSNPYSSSYEPEKGTGDTGTGATPSLFDQMNSNV